MRPISSNVFSRRKAVGWIHLKARRDRRSQGRRESIADTVTACSDETVLVTLSGLGPGSYEGGEFPVRA